MESKRLKRILLVLPLMLLMYLLAWPVDIIPVEWTPPPAPSTKAGLYAANDKLRGVQRIADGAVTGPEAIAFDAKGRLFAGLEDGRVVSMTPDGADCRVAGNTGGRPIGLNFAGDGSLMIADARRGLLRLTSDGQFDVVTTDVDGIRLNFTDDLDIDSRGRVLFSDASWKFGYGDHATDALEHGSRGRLMLYDPEKKAGATLLAQLDFANGVALGPDEQYVLVNQTTSYRITRYWLKGEKAGTADLFIENLPGFPDNITFNGRDRFWVALFAPRNAMLDATLPYPFLRTVIARLPKFLMPSPKRQAFILGLDLDGKVVEQYQYAGKDAYGPITSVREHEGVLFLGSLSDTAVGRIALADLRSNSAALNEPPPAITAECRAAG